MPLTGPTVSAPPVDLGNTSGSGNLSAAYSVNDSGEIVGFSAINDSASETVACFWTNSSSPGINLGTLGGTDGSANSINSPGHIVGSADTASGSSHAAYWTNYTSPPIDLSTLGTGPNSEANSINNAGAIAGDSDLTGSPSISHAAYWASYASTPQDLGLLARGSSSIATCLNNLGELVGMCALSNSPARPIVAVVWDSPAAAAEDLNTLIPTNSGWYLTQANGINNQGVIVGAGVFTNAQNVVRLHAYALVPITNADLSLSVASSVFSNNVVFNYTITISNAGPATATGVVLSNQIPASAVFVSASGGATTNNGVLLVNVGTLAPGATNVVLLTEQPVLFGGAITNIFSVFGNQPDPNPANNTVRDVSYQFTLFSSSTLSLTDNIPSTVTKQNTNFSDHVDCRDARRRRGLQQ